jgi:hypothetical protein
VSRPTAIILLAFLLAFFGWNPRAEAGFRTTGNVNFLLGAKDVGYSGISDQRAAAVDITGGIQGLPLLLDAYSSGSWGKGRNSFGDPLTEARYETGGGLIATWAFGSFHPHLGAGLGRTTWKVQHESDERKFQVAEANRWIAGGGFWRFASGVNVGVAVRSSTGHHRYPELGGTHYGLTLGWGWPRGRP